jgi:hypothetical protein
MTVETFKMFITMSHESDCIGIYVFNFNEVLQPHCLKGFKQSWKHAMLVQNIEMCHARSGFGPMCTCTTKYKATYGRQQP